MLSRRDRRTSRHIAQHPAAQLPRPLMLLFASADGQWRVAAWEFVDGALQRCTLYAAALGELLEGDTLVRVAARGRRARVGTEEVDGSRRS
jgi:hypothetical protein